MPKVRKHKNTVNRREVKTRLLLDCHHGWVVLDLVAHEALRGNGCSYLLGLVVRNYYEESEEGVRLAQQADDSE